MQSEKIVFRFLIILPDSYFQGTIVVETVFPKR